VSEQRHTLFRELKRLGVRASTASDPREVAALLDEVTTLRARLIAQRDAQAEARQAVERGLAAYTAYGRRK
jgi:hypothetical protein